MLATLVAVLPSRHTGATIVVTHNGKRHALAGGGADDDVRLVAFYADCRHEVERVKTGHRVALIYHLVHDGPDGAQEPADAGSSSASLRLTASMRAYFATPTRLPAAVLVEVLHRCRQDCPPRELRGLGLGPLHERAARSLRDTLAQPPRASDDWSLASPLDCDCALCKRLAAFLRDRNARELPWPLAKDGRRHVHGMIERFDLPVAHDTIRKGSPHTLMLEKQAVLFSREAAERKRGASLLAALERARPVYVNTTGSSPRRRAEAPPTRAPRASSDRARLSRP